MKSQWALWATACVLSAYSVVGMAETKAQKPLEPLSPISQNAPEINIDGLGKNQALAVFYRANDVAGAPISVYVDGNYQASLRANTLSKVAVCADKQLFSASFNHNDGFGNRTNGLQFVLPIQNVAFFKLRLGADGQPIFARVDDAVARQEIAQLPEANQTLSRVPPVNTRQCREPVVLHTQTILANALFGFNQFDVQGMEATGRTELSKLAQQVKALDASKITKVVISGYTDPEGDEAYNRQLSQKRAEQVRAVLQENGLNMPMEAVGLGQSQLLVANCAQLHANDVQAKRNCNQPNRRVEVTVYGNVS